MSQLRKRESKISYNPVGWHNYNFYYGDGSKKAWLMSRGHLISLPIYGLNDEKRNLVPMTNWLNAGNYSGTDDQNKVACFIMKIDWTLGWPITPTTILTTR